MRGWNRFSGRCVQLFVIVVGVSWATGGVSEQRWGPHADLNVRPGNGKTIGELQLFIPAWQNHNSMLFLDLRGNGDNDEDAEGNAGLGYRRLVKDWGWIVGGYGFFDARYSDRADEMFYGATLGLEALSENFDVRANGYIPEDTDEDLDGPGRITFSGNSVAFRQNQVTPLYGVDGEIGWRIPFPKDSMFWDTRVYMGGFHFDGDGAEDLTGPRGRAEMRLHQIPLLPANSRLTLGVDVRNDDERDTEVMGLVSLRIPFGGAVGRAGASDLTLLERRMVDPIVRDVEIQTGNTLGSAEGVVHPLTGGPVTSVFFAAEGGTGDGSSGSPDSLDDAITAAGDDGIVVVLNGGGDIDAQSTPADLSDGQILVGGGASVTLQSATGQPGLFTAPGGGATITDSVGDSATLVTLADDNIVSGLSLTNGSIGVDASDASNGILENLTVDGNTDGVFMEDDGVVLVRNSTFTNNDNGLFVQVEDTGDASVSVLNSIFLENDTGINIQVEDHDDGDIHINAQITGNQFLQNSANGLIIDVNDADSDDEFEVRIVADITGNRFFQNGDNGAFLKFDNDADADDGGFRVITNFRDNVFEENANHGVNVEVESWFDSDFTLDLDFTNNRFVRNMSNGLNIDVVDSDLDTGVIEMNTWIVGNTFLGNVDDGLYIGVFDEAMLNADIVNNVFTDNGDDGMEIEVDASQTSDVFIGGNQITGSGDVGIVIDAFDTNITSTLPGQVLDNTVSDSGTSDTDLLNTTGSIQVNGAPVSSP